MRPSPHQFTRSSHDHKMGELKTGWLAKRPNLNFIWRLGSWSSGTFLVQKHSLWCVCTSLKWPLLCMCTSLYLALFPFPHSLKNTQQKLTPSTDTMWVSLPCKAVGHLSTMSLAIFPWKLMSRLCMHACVKYIHVISHPLLNVWAVSFHPSFLANVLINETLLLFYICRNYRTFQLTVKDTFQTNVTPQLLFVFFSTDVSEMLVIIASSKKTHVQKNLSEVLMKYLCCGATSPSLDSPLLRTGRCASLEICALATSAAQQMQHDVKSEAEIEKGKQNKSDLNWLCDITELFTELHVRFSLLWPQIKKRGTAKEAFSSVCLQPRMLLPAIKQAP